MKGQGRGKGIGFRKGINEREERGEEKCIASMGQGEKRVTAMTDGRENCKLGREWNQISGKGTDRQTGRQATVV